MPVNNSIWQKKDQAGVGGGMASKGEVAWESSSFCLSENCKCHFNIFIWNWEVWIPGLTINFMTLGKITSYIGTSVSVL